MFRVPYRWIPRCWWSNLRSCWFDVTNGVRNLWRWLPIIWFDHDYDWVCIATILEFKLRKHAELELKHGHHTGSERDAKHMLICATLLKRLQADDYFENAGYDRGKWASVPNARQRQIAKHAAKMQAADQRYLGVILGKYLTHWWD